MRTAFATLAFVGLVSANPYPVPQAVTSAIAPKSSPPPGCLPDYSGTFEIGPVNVSSSSKRDLSARGLDERNTHLGISLQGGILTDPLGRTGYIAANEQFQFDGPPQAGAIYTSGFSVCENGSLALGSDVIWWKCLSGSFYNLYFKSIGGQCIESYLIAVPVGGVGGPVSSATTTRYVTATAGTTTAGTSTGSETASATVSTTTSASGSSSSTSASGSASTTSTVTVVKGSNSTTSGSASASASGSSTIIITSKSTTITSVVGVGHHTTAKGKTTGGAKQTTTTGGGAPTTKKAAATSSVSPGAAPQATFKAEMFGLAAGVLALAAL